MYWKLLQLEIKNFFRNPQFGTNLALKILSIFGMLSLTSLFVLGAFFVYYYVKEEMHADPLKVFCQYFVYYWAYDLVVRYFMQQMPTQNIKPFLTSGIEKKTLVKYTIVKIIFNFFNWGNLLFIVPFTILLLRDGGYSALGVILFNLSIFLIFYFNNFLNILLNGKNAVVYSVFGIMMGFAALQYFNILSLSDYSEKIIYALYEYPFLIIIPLLLLVGVGYSAYKMIYNNFYLDKGLELKKTEGKTENIEFLNKYGVTGTFINNDIRLLKRSKAAKSALFASVLFLLYGLLVFNPAYKTPFMQLFTGIFVTGGFMMMFGQRVPSWDSSYYPLMMTQKVPYREYLKGKWALIVLGIIVSMIFSTAYLLVSVEVYLTMLAAGLYNLGVNSYITLLAGAFNKKPIDLNSSAKTFGGGGGNNMNLKVALLLIPQLVLPMVVFGIVKLFFGIYAGVGSLAVLGIIGFFLKNTIFNYIVSIYKTQKYSTLEAFKKA